MVVAIVASTVAAAVACGATLSSDVRTAFSAVVLYYRALWHILIAKGSYDDLRKLCGAPREPIWSKSSRKTGVQMTPEEEQRLFMAVWLQSISLTLSLWSTPHYRADSLRDDLIGNFSNIAFPGTGFKMSIVCWCKAFAVLYFVVVHPWVVAAASVAISRSPVHAAGRSPGRIFADELLAPRHWFALWRINSTLAHAHHAAHKDAPEVQDEYRYENKWDFIEHVLELEKKNDSIGFRTAPILADIEEIVCKHKNIEGGMGIHVFKNATKGGDWILQKRIYNSKELQALLPERAPLSTFRVITMADPTADSFETSHKAMTFVWRAGRAGKSTDHSALMFGVDAETLRIQDAKMFSNWYQVGTVGLSNLLSKQGLTQHPDTKVDLHDHELHCASDAVQMCVNAHRGMLPNVPAVGWDIAVAEGEGAVLLEANLSCNFFGGGFDKQHFLRIVDTYYANGCRPGSSFYGACAKCNGKVQSTETIKGKTNDKTPIGANDKAVGA